MDWIFRTIFLLLALLLYSLGPVYATDITVVWDAPELRTDGTPLTDIAGYRICFSHRHIPDTGSVSADCDTVTSPDVLTVTILTVYNVTYIRALVFDAQGFESALSNEVSVDLKKLGEVPPAAIHLVIADVVP